MPAGSAAALICDTGALIDYLVESAPDHTRFRDAIDQARTRYVPGLVLAEVTAKAGAASQEEDADRVRAAAGADVGVALRIVERGADTAVSVAVSTPGGTHRERRLAFLGGVQGRHRAGLAAADILLRQLRQAEISR